VEREGERGRGEREGEGRWRDVLKMVIMMRMSVVIILLDFVCYSFLLFTVLCRIDIPEVLNAEAKKRLE
jgi:hypothetical protein